MEFASTIGVTSLFHYCRFDVTYFEDLLANDRIYMSDTANFNDPWDCRPCFDSSRIGDPDYADRLVERFYQSARRQTPHIPEAFHRARAAELRASEDALRAAIDKMSDMELEIVKRYRVFCLTTKPTNILMWSHYAENHKGVCIEFSCDNFVFSGAYKVEYADRYPIYDFTDDTDDRILLPLISKSQSWAYEDEYRLIAQERSVALAYSLMTDNNYLALPKGSIRSVILGCSAPDDIKAAVADIVARYKSGVVTRSLRRVPNVYELAFS